MANWYLRYLDLERRHYQELLRLRSAEAEEILRYLAETAEKAVFFAPTAVEETVEKLASLMEQLKNIVAKARGKHAQAV